MLAGNTSSAPPIPAAAGDSYSRLHIRPLDPELLKVVVPAAVLPKARNISFHTLETFPENRYGFIDLPAVDAEKIRKKFNLSTLRGRKMRVEKARPEKIPEAGGGSGDEADAGKKRKKKSSGDREDRESKKQKRDYNTVEGVHLPEGRKVKRGWTATPAEVRKEKKTKSKDKADKKAKKMAVRSKYTEKAECLMKTVPPPNAPIAADAAGIDKRRKKGKSKREVVAHEFQHTTKFPNFIKASAAPEEEKPEAPGLIGISNATAASKRQKKIKKPEPEEDAESVSESSSDDSDSSSDSDSDSSSEEEQEENAVEDKSDSESSDEESDSESESGSTTGGDKAGVVSPPGSARPKSSSLSIQIPPPSTPAAVHPLEALYKKAKKEDNVQVAPADEPFSFFGNGDDEEDEDEDEREEPARSSQPPMTPFSKQDFEQRNIRSAAPTPDTAHPSRAARAFWAPNAGGLEEEDESESPIRRGLDRGDEAGAEGPTPIGDFSSWFYDNRRELNRSWMDRRKSAKKEKRQRDNRAKGR